MIARNQYKINYGDEKIIIKILYGGFSAYQKLQEKPSSFFCLIRFTFYKTLNHIFVKWMNGCNIPLSMKVGGYVHTSCQWNCRTRKSCRW